MRRLVFVLLIGCGGGSSTPIDAAIDTRMEPLCQPVGATGQWFRRTGNPRLVAGHQFPDAKLDISISDPSLAWDGSSWQLYYATAHGTSYTSADLAGAIRHATAPDATTWTVDDPPALVVASDPAAWDHVNTETPTVIENPAASPDHRFLMLYSGANGMFPGQAFANYAIGAAFSADGKTFTRVPAAQSPHGKEGLVLTGADVYPGAAGAIVADPELALVNNLYHLWFSSYACTGASCATVMAYGIGHATSTDGIHWTVAEAPVRSLLRASADPTTGGGQASVVYDAFHCRYEMWFTSDAPTDTAAQPVVFNNMAGVWHADSTDGVTWHPAFTGPRDLAWDKTATGEHLGLLTGADVADKNGARYMVYVGFDDQNVPTGFALPDRSTLGYEPGVTTLGLATRDATGPL